MHQIRYFLAVAEELNFTRAAERCNVTQPSLTRAIQMLEAELGGLLFHRERTNTHLSELGRLTKPYLEQVFAQAQEVKRKATDFIGLKRATIKIGVMCTIAPTNLLVLLRNMRNTHPGVELQILDGSPELLHEMLLSGDVEVAISCHPEPETDTRLHRQPLFREQFVIVVDPEHRLAPADAIRVKDLEGENYLERTHCEFGIVATRIFNDQNVTDVTVYRSERDDWILAMAAAGLGYAFMPAHCVNHPGVVARPLTEPEIWREISLVTVRGRRHSAALGALVREAMRTAWDQQAFAKPSLSNVV